MNDINTALRQKFQNINSQLSNVSSGATAQISGARHEEHFTGITVLDADQMAKAKSLTEKGVA